MTEKITVDHLSGKADGFLKEMRSWHCMLHREVVDPMQNLIALAADAGYELSIASAHRSFERQCLIWNEKLNGVRPVLNDLGQTIDLTPLTEREKVFAVLRWSALPGLSRHHWGTEIDIYERTSLPKGYQLQLTVDETRPNGVMGTFYNWLERYLSSGDNNGFFRPYFLRGDELNMRRVGDEPWHLSFAPVAQQYQSLLTLEVAKEIVSSCDILLRDAVMENIDEIFQNYVLVDPVLQKNISS